MIKDFETLKKQLTELANIINNFKSEAVQVRLVELIFDADPLTENVVKDVVAPKTARKRRGAKRVNEKQPRAKTDPKHTEVPKQKKAKSGRAGPGAILSQLIDEKYFAQKRTLSDIISHCAKKAHNYKPNELSTPLARFTRDNRLKRDKNADGQYEYQQ